MDLFTKFKDGRTDLIFDLLKEGYDASSMDDNGYPLIGWCAYYGDVSAVRYLLESGASIDLLGQNYDLNGAAFHGHWQLCQFLLDNGANASYVLEDCGETALHNVLCSPNRPANNLIVTLLLGHGADPNARTIPGKETGGFMRDVRTVGETPLHRAAAFGNEETIRLLIEAGADKTIRDAHGDSPISWASWHCRPGKILELLTFEGHRIHDLHVKNMQSDHGSGWGSGMSIMRMGKIHL